MFVDIPRRAALFWKETEEWWKRVGWEKEVGGEEGGGTVVNVIDIIDKSLDISHTSWAVGTGTDN